MIDIQTVYDQIGQMAAEAGARRAYRSATTRGDG